MRNKILIFSGVILFGVIVSYIAFGWSEPTGNMPSDYRVPLNTSANAQDVDEDKPVITNLDADQVDGYEASDLLAATIGSGDWFSRGDWTLLTSKVVALNKTCSGFSGNGQRSSFDAGIQIPENINEFAWCLRFGNSQTCSVYGTLPANSDTIQMAGDAAGSAMM